MIAMSVAAGFAQTSTKITKQDIQTFTGNWKGTLTYLDYTSNKPYTMPADIVIKQTGKSNVFIFFKFVPR